jgi:hypothetical protein
MSATLSLPPLNASAPAALARCPFHDGLVTLDLLLAEIDSGETALFDAALDLRSLCAARSDPAACVEQLFRVRGLLGGRHYLAFYRVRCWAHRAIRIEVRTGRGSPWMAQPFPRDSARLDEVINAALASLATPDGAIPSSAYARFVLAPNLT